MRRIRFALVALSVAVLVPVAVLAWRALEGLASQRAVRHQAVAERAFDEMERVLSGFLEREEERAFEHYRFYLDSLEGQRSPLASPAAEPFVVGAFQVDPDGALHTPLRPRDVALARARGDWPPPPEVERAIEVVTRVVRDARQGGRLADRFESAPVTQAPGTTRRVGGAKADKRLEQAKKDADVAATKNETAYEVLRRFNRGAESRASRKQKVEQKVASAPAPAPMREAKLSEGASLDALEEDAADIAVAQEAGVAVEAEAADERSAFGDRLRDDSAQAPMAAVAKAGRPPAEPLPAPRDMPSALRVALDPMVGRLAGDDYMLLYRTALVGPEGYQQGLLIDRRALGVWLEEQVIAPAGLAEAATVSFLVRGDDTPDDGGDYVFQHRFAEPFDPVTARLALAALPGVGSPGAIYGLVALLVGVGAVGLFAVHRMVAVTVHFAERRNNFVAAVTHELKTPLTAIRMYGEMLRDGLVDEDAKRERYYRTITDESERLTRLIDNVLEFSRLERNARDMSWTVGSVGPVLDEAAEKLRAHAANEGFRLEVQTEAGLPAVRFDRDALLQVIFNLVDNAMKYARDADSKVVVVEAHVRDGRVIVSVRDFGPGVPGRHVARIFEPFYRPEDELTRSTKGTGIGLALVKDLAERMGAAVTGVNESGGGFRVCLAFHPADGRG